MFAAIKTHAWAYPALEVVHIVGIALLLGNLVLLELRIFGAGKRLDVLELARLSLPIAAIGFAFAAISGLLMFASNPQELLANRMFVTKMALLVLAAANAAWFHGRNSLTRLDALAKTQLLASTAIWLAVLTCGRWIAYR